MAKDSSEEVYVSVDVEAAGPIPGTYSMLALGACVVGSPSNGFYVELRPINENVVPEAIDVSGLSVVELAQKGTEPHDAMAQFADWLRDVAGDRRPVFVGFNAAFDWSFVNWYFHTHLKENPFGFAPLDIKAFYMGMSGCLWSETSSRQIPLEFQSTNAAIKQPYLPDRTAGAARLGIAGVVPELTPGGGPGVGAVVHFGAVFTGKSGSSAAAAERTTVDPAASVQMVWGTAAPSA